MKRLTVILLVLTNISFGQNKFDAFIKNPGIEWAIYNIDSVHFLQTNLSEILRTRFNNNEIKAAFPVDIMLPGDHQYQLYPAAKLNKEIFHPHDMRIIDSVGNAAEAVDPQENNPPARYFDPVSFNVAEVVQVLFIRDGKLSSYVPFVSPKMSIATSSGIFLGLSNYFSSSFNYSYKTRPSRRKNLIPLSQTKRFILQDSTYRSINLKSMYGRGLVASLWPYIIKEKLKIFDANTGKSFSIDSLIKDFALNDPNRYQPGDSILYTRYRNDYTDKLPLSYINKLEIVQDWFYDKKKNMVFNTTLELRIHMRPWKKEQGVDPEGIVFKIPFD